jgi:hypothetical protein
MVKPLPSSSPAGSRAGYTRTLLGVRSFSSQLWTAHAAGSMQKWLQREERNRVSAVG